MNDDTKELVKLSIKEDLGPRLGENTGDITSIACIDPSQTGSANILFKESGVVCGHDIVEYLLNEIDSSLSYEVFYEDGKYVEKGQIASKINGSIRNILTAERTLLNFMQRLSAISTLTKSVVSLLNNANIKILDTRKTTPGFREIEKYAVKIGGGTTHRMGLYDEFMIKNNHVDALGGDIRVAVGRCRALKPNIFLTVEVRDRNEIVAALESNVDALLLDNFEAEALKVEVDWIRENGGKGIRLEASGGVTPLNVVEYSKTGVDAISLGYLTHSVKSLDISLRYVKS